MIGDSDCAVVDTTGGRLGAGGPGAYALALQAGLLEAEGDEDVVYLLLLAHVLVRPAGVVFVFVEIAGVARLDEVFKDVVQASDAA